jgi:hypothetical protein
MHEVNSSYDFATVPPAAARQLDARPGAAVRTAPLKPRSERDLRLDFWRGVALFVIFVDHIPANPLGSWTLRNFAFCDAAEAFVLISGISSYLAYGSLLEREGMAGLYAAIARRCAKIYCAHIFLILAVAAALLTAASLFAHPAYEDAFRMTWMFSDPAAAIAAALSLRYLPNLLDILPLYLVLLGAAPAIIWIVKRDVRIALGLSIFVYAAARWSGFNLPAGNDGEVWNFNPLTWQLLYTIGIAAAHLRKGGRAAPPLVRKIAIGGALVFVTFAFVMAAPWRGAEIGLALFRPDFYLWPAEKTMLSPLRVINVLALFWLVACFIAPQARWLKSRAAAPLLSCGRHSLAVFGTGVWLSAVAFIVLNQTGYPISMLVTVNIVGLLAMAGLAAALDRARAGRTASAAVRGAVAAPAFARRAA